jgi:hypothetical protein
MTKFVCMACALLIATVSAQAAGGVLDRLKEQAGVAEGPRVASPEAGPTRSPGVATVMLTASDIALLRAAIQPGWSSETAWHATWDPANPPLNQCAVTAMVLQDFLGGDLIHTTVGGISHYFNRLPGGQEIDLTRDQFPPGSPIGTSTVVPRKQLDRSADTVRRYRLLRRRVEAGLAPLVAGFRSSPV